jgi:hypothetical protein
MRAKQLKSERLFWRPANRGSSAESILHGLKPHR